MNFIPLIFYSLSFLLIVIYALVVFKALCGIKSSKRNTIITDSQIKIDVIVSYRNERENLPVILESLQQQTYQNFRVIWVNDHSTDDGEKFLKANINGDSHLLLCSDKLGKKAAINEALKQVEADLIVFTDADCTHDPRWLVNYASEFKKKGSGLYFGSVVYDTNSFLQDIFALEFLSLMGTGMGLAGAGFPVFMNGANYAISKDLLKLHHFKEGANYASGDDVFLLHQVKKIHGAGKIYPLYNSELNVKTAAPVSLAAFFKQRIRWGGKTSGYTDLDSLLLAALIFTICLLQIGSLFFVCFSIWGLLIWPAKAILDFFALNKYAKIWYQKHFMASFLILTPLYPFYIFSAAIIGLFASNKKW